MTLKEALQSNSVTVVNYDLKTYVVLSSLMWRITRWLWRRAGGCWVAFQGGKIVEGSEEGLKFHTTLERLQELQRYLKSL